MNGFRYNIMVSKIGGCRHSFHKALELMLCIFIAFTGMQNHVYAQSRDVSDSLWVDQRIMSVKDTTTPMRIVAIGKEVVAYSTDKKYGEGMARGLISIAVGYGRGGDTKNSIDYFIKAIAICKENKLYVRQGRAELGLGQMYQRLGQSDKAFETITDAINAYSALHDSVNIAVCYAFLGSSMMGMRRWTEAEQYYNRALELNLKLKQYGQIVYDYSDLGAVNIEMKQYEKAFGYFRKAQILADARNDTFTNMYLNFAVCFQQTLQYDSAIFYYKKSIHRSELLHDVEDLCKIYINLGELYFKTGKLAEAEAYSKQALEIAQKIENEEAIMSASGNLSEIYATKKDYKSAYEYYVMTYAANDSIMNGEKTKAITEMQVKYNVSELENRNMLLQKENDLQKLRLQRRNIVMYGTVSAAILLFIIGFQVVRHNKLKADQKLLQVEQKQLLAQINPHFIFNCLNSIQQFVVQNDTLNANKYLADFALLMRQTLDNSKDGVISLQRELDYLANYLSFESMRFEDRFAYTITCAQDVNPNTVEIPSMIVQPFVENAIRHGLYDLAGRVGKLAISFYKKENCLYCEVDDNGIGMEEAQKLKEQRIIKYQSHGMEITRQRLELVSKMKSSDYKIIVVNKKDMQQNPAGTTIIIKFPLDV